MKKFRKSWIIALAVVIFLIIASSLPFFLNKSKEGVQSTENLPFKVDQLLIKVLVKEKESFLSPVNIMDISNDEIDIQLEAKYLMDIAGISENSFSLKPGQTKTVNIDFRRWN